MSTYSGEEVQGETDANQPCSAFFLVRARGVGLHLSHPNREQQPLASVLWRVYHRQACRQCSSRGTDNRFADHVKEQIRVRRERAFASLVPLMRVNGISSFEQSCFIHEREAQAT